MDRHYLHYPRRRPDQHLASISHHIAVDLFFREGAALLRPGFWIVRVRFSVYEAGFPPFFPVAAFRCLVLFTCSARRRQPQTPHLLNYSQR